MTRACAQLPEKVQVSSCLSRQPPSPCLSPPRALCRFPPQALLLSHEGATKQELEPYFQEVVKPLVPLVLYGRFAKREPACHKQECVYYFWRGRRCRAPGRGARLLFSLCIFVCMLFMQFSMHVACRELAQHHAL